LLTLLGYDNDINGLQGLWIVSIDVKEKSSNWDGTNEIKYHPNVALEKPFYKTHATVYRIVVLEKF
jgi:hypothetical protein